jgi:hypothetical protein
LEVTWDQVSESRIPRLVFATVLVAAIPKGIKNLSVTLRAILAIWPVTAFPSRATRQRIFRSRRREIHFPVYEAIDKPQIMPRQAAETSLLKDP